MDFQPPNPKDQRGSPRLLYRKQRVKSVGPGVGGRRTVRVAERGGPERKPRDGESRETRRRMDNSGSPELRRAIQLLGFSSSRSQSFWGPLPPRVPTSPPPGGQPGLCLASARGSLSLGFRGGSGKPTLVLGRGKERRQKEKVQGWGREWVRKERTPSSGCCADHIPQRSANLKLLVMRQ